MKPTQTTGTVIIYTIAANHLSTVVTELPEYIAKNARTVSCIQVAGGSGSSDSIHNEDGSINTGHISNWKSLLFKDQKIFIDESKRLGIKYKSKGGAGDGGVWE